MGTSLVDQVIESENSDGQQLEESPGMDLIFKICMQNRLLVTIRNIYMYIIYMYFIFFR